MTTQKRVIVQTMRELNMALQQREYSIWVKGDLARQVVRMKRTQKKLWGASFLFVVCSVCLFLLTLAAQQTAEAKQLGLEMVSTVGISLTVSFLLAGLFCALAAMASKVRKYVIISYTPGVAHLQRVLV